LPFKAARPLEDADEGFQSRSIAETMYEATFWGGAAQPGPLFTLFEAAASCAALVYMI